MWRPSATPLVLLQAVALVPPVAASRAAWIACQTRSLVAGISSVRTPSGASAFRIAIMVAGMAPTVPASPAPFAPNRLVAVGTGLLLIAMLHIVSARGIA